MNEDSTLIETFKNHLIKNGFPEDEFVIGLSISPNKNADLAIVSKDSGDILAIFEVKSHGIKDSKNVVRQLNDYDKLIGRSVSKYAISKEAGKIVLYRVKDDSLEKVGSIPAIETLQAISKYNKKVELKQKTDFLKYQCYAFILCLIFILIADFNGSYLLTVERLGIIVVIVGISIVPYSSILKLPGGFEFQRNKKTNKE